MLTIQKKDYNWTWFLYRYKNDKNTILGFEYAGYRGYIRYSMNYNNSFSDYCVVI